jgi:hypothetical protein
MKGQYDMPSIDSYEPIRRRMAFSLMKPMYHCFSTPIRFLYSSVRTTLLYEPEQSKLEIFRQMNEYMRCSANAGFQRAYHKGIKSIAPLLPDQEFQCEVPKITVV